MEQHSTDIDSALAALDVAPLSRRKAMLLALLIDAEIERRANDDVLEFRARLAALSPALAIVIRLAAMREGGPRLVLEPVVVLAEIEGLSEAEYMVSLYNGGCVPRLLIADGAARAPALSLLRQAVAALATGNAAPD